MKSQVLPIDSNRIRKLAAAALCSALLLSGMAPQASELARETQGFVSVIIRGLTGTAHADAVVDSQGGRITRYLPIIDGVSADVPAASIERMRDAGLYVERDAKVEFQSHFNENQNQRIQKTVRSTDLWGQNVNGNGITVALLDTGVYAAHPDLQGTSGSRVIACEDLTTEAEDPQTKCQDTFGHGTFMAGLIAGNGASSNGKYSGMAPKANIVSVKAAGYDGSTDVSTILAGIQYVVAQKDVYGIRVLNLSLGTDSAQDYRLSPLNYAVERAWNAGIAVVVSAGNSGPDAGTILKPGDDPYVITVGSSSDMGNWKTDNDRIAVYSSRGPTRANGLAKPDLVAPGVHTVSLRAPGSAIDTAYGASARVDTQYFKGTGTSMSTAVTTGVVAQVLQKNPLLNPNQVKHRLVSTAQDLVDSDPHMVGAGVIDAKSAANSLSLAEANQGLESSTGLGLIALDRGSVDTEIFTPQGGIALGAEVTAQTDPALIDASNPAGLIPWVGVTYTLTGWDPVSWDATQWKTEDWAATQWKGTQWKATVWDGTQWKGTQWKNDDWEATQWKDFVWEGTQWKGTQWKTAWYAVAWD